MPCCDGSRQDRRCIAGARAMRMAQVLFGLTCIFYGWSHFAYADYTASMVPAWLPDRLGIAYFTGLGHVAAGIGVVVGILPRLAATLEAIMMSFIWPSGLGAELFCASPARMGRVAAKSMVRTRGEFGVGRLRVARRDFLERPPLGLALAFTCVTEAAFGARQRGASPLTTQPKKPEKVPAHKRTFASAYARLKPLLIVSG